MTQKRRGFLVQPALLDLRHRPLLAMTADQKSGIIHISAGSARQGHYPCFHDLRQPQPPTGDNLLNKRGTPSVAKYISLKNQRSLEAVITPAQPGVVFCKPMALPWLPRDIAFRLLPNGCTFFTLPWHLTTFSLLTKDMP